MRSSRGPGDPRSFARTLQATWSSFSSRGNCPKVGHLKPGSGLGYNTQMGMTKLIVILLVFTMALPPCGLAAQNPGPGDPPKAELCDRNVKETLDKTRARKASSEKMLEQLNT